MDGDSATIRLELNNFETNALIDSGAKWSVIDIGTVSTIGLEKEIRRNSRDLINASGEKMDIIGEVDIIIKSDKISPVTHPFKVLNTRTFSNILLGRDFMRHYGKVTFDFEKNRLKLDKWWIKTVTINRKDNVRMSKNSTIPARTEAVTTVRCSKNYSLLTADFEPRPLPGRPGVFITKARVIPNIDGIFQITMLNTTEKDVTVCARKVVGHVTPPADSICIADENSEKTLEKISFGDKLTASEKKIVKDLVNEYDDIFATNPKKPKRTSLVEHAIITNEALPVKRKYKRIPLAWENEVETQIQEMLDNDIIRPSTSPWNAPLILVKKKDNTSRFVCDFRGLNDVTKKDTYPLPNIRDVLDNMHGSRYWSTLDAASAYWSMPLVEKDKEKTAFSVRGGKFEFNVTPYGLSNAGASYQRMIDICLAGLPPDRVLAYLDDIVIFSATFDQHISDLRNVFEKLRTANISLKASKCVIAADEVEYLGYELGANGIKPQKRLTEAILKFEKPESRKDVKRFLGLAGYYRNFVDGFANISRPLNKSTSDNTPFVWDDDCEIAFRTLKTLLAEKPILAFPRIGEQFIVDVDASDCAFGGVLMQKGEDGKLHPVAYFSDSVQKSQSNWSATTKEAFALVLATRHWYVYLAGINFVLNSDHNPLQYLRNQKDPRGKFGRWLMELEEFSYKVEYIPGIENVRADPLSRNRGASLNQPPDELEEKIYAISSNNDNFREQVKFEQNKDPIITHAKNCIDQGESINQGRLKRVQKQLRVENGILTKSGRPVLPPSLRKYVVERIHQVAHFGTDKIYALVKDRYYWPNMYAFINTFVRVCEPCQKTKCDTNPPRAPLLPMFVPSAPMQLISIDIAFMPVDNDGYRYILLVGDTFSKFINGIPLREQTAPAIVKAFTENWLYTHGNPNYLLSDQGSNVDGDVMREFCDTFGIEKRRSSAYHSQGNGFAERNIRSIRDMMRSVLIDRKTKQTKWRQLLPELIFALNCSESKAIQAVPFEIVYGRKATLPIDILFNNDDGFPQNDIVSPSSYAEELNLKMKIVFDHVIEKLNISKEKMKKQYDKKVNLNHYNEGDKVWLKIKYYKQDQNRKLSPRRNAPWTISKKLPNGNFEIRKNGSNERKIVHHDRLTPIKEIHNADVDIPCPLSNNEGNESDATATSESGSDDESDYETCEDISDNEAEPVNVNNRRYPLRARTQRQIPNAIPWSSVHL